MGRPWREEYRGGIYHVIARGNNKEYIFKESIDKGYFIKLLKEYDLAMGYTIYGYVLMDNHYHIIIQTLDKKLQAIMHQINNKYSKYFNYKYERVGHVYQGRYKAVLIQDERYLIQVLRYIHQNPLRAGLCRKVQEYKWSSDIYYRKQIDSFINTKVVMDMLGKDINKAKERYIELMNEEELEDYSNLQSIGDDAYQIMCTSRRRIIQRKRLDEILAEACATMEEYELIKEGSRRRNLTPYKLQFVRAALELHYGYSEIGDKINMSASAVLDMLNRYSGE